MNNEKYICPRCGKEMSWTGNISQDLSENYCAAILYEYKCWNYKCGYKSKYKLLDDNGMKYKNMIDMGMVE